MAFLLCRDERQLRQFACVHDAYQHVRKAFRVANLLLYVVEVRKNREIRRRIRLHDRRTVLHVLLDAAELEESASAQSFQVLSAFLLQRAPDGIIRAVCIKKLLQVSIERTHFIRGAHRVVGCADFAEARRRHQLEEA